MRLLSKNSTGSYKVYNISDGRLLTSYGTKVAIKNSNGVTLDERYWDYSVTTAKHVGQFLGIRSKEIRKLIKDGIINLENLN